MKCGVAEGWRYPSTRGNLLTAGARWRYSLAQEHSAHSDTTASVCTPGSLAVIYDASHAITLSLTLIQQFIYWWHAYRQRCASRGDWGGGQNNCLPSASATSIVSQETNHALGSLKPDEVCFFFFLKAICDELLSAVWCYRKQLNWTNVVSSSPALSQVLHPAFLKNKTIQATSWPEPKHWHRAWPLTQNNAEVLTVKFVIAALTLKSREQLSIGPHSAFLEDTFGQNNLTVWFNQRHPACIHPTTCKMQFAAAFLMKTFFFSFFLVHKVLDI